MRYIELINHTKRQLAEPISKLLFWLLPFPHLEKVP